MILWHCIDLSLHRYRGAYVSVRLSLCWGQPMPKICILFCLVQIKKMSKFNSCVFEFTFWNASSHLCFWFFCWKSCGCDVFSCIQHSSIDVFLRIHQKQLKLPFPPSWLCFFPQVIPRRKRLKIALKQEKMRASKRNDGVREREIMTSINSMDTKRGS